MTGPLEEELFGAPVYAGAVNPTCVVAVDGVDVAAGSASAAADALMVVDGLSVTWGREEIRDQPTPATGRLTLFDPSRTWATREDRRGRLVTLRWAGVDNVTGAPVGAVFFRGRIGDPVTVSLRTVTRPKADGSGETVRGALVQIPLQSALVDLANVVPRVAWPVETLLARVDRIVTEARKYGLLAGGANIRDEVSATNVAAVAVDDQVSLLEHLTACFTSAAADSYTYQPHTDAVIFVMRRDYGSPTLGQLDRTTTGARANQGTHIRARTLTGGPPDDVGGNNGLLLDAGTLEYDPAEGITTPARITRVAVTHPDEGNGYKLRTVEIPVRREPWDPAGGSAPLDETVLGVRTARVDSLVAWNSYGDMAADNVERLVRQEGSRWLLQPLRLSTRKTGGFHSTTAAQLFLSGWERGDNVFLQRSWLPALGIRPVFGIMGATIGYARGGWDVEFTTAPVNTAQLQHPLTYEDLRTTDPALWIKAWDGPHPEGFDPTVTYEDLRYVGRGLDLIDPAPSLRDEYQP